MSNCYRLPGRAGGFLRIINCIVSLLEERETTKGHLEKPCYEKIGLLIPAKSPDIR